MSNNMRNRIRLGVLGLWLALSISIWPSIAAQAGDISDEAATRRTIHSCYEGGWIVVDVQTVTGRPLTLSTTLGCELDISEIDKLGIFQGPSVYTNSKGIEELQVPVSGLRSAMFLVGERGRPLVWLKCCQGSRDVNHAVYLKNTTIRNFKRYIEELSTQGRFMPAESVGKAHLTTESPGRSVSFDVVQPVDSLLVRRKGAVVTVAGNRHRGELIPVFEDDSILLDTSTFPQITHPRPVPFPALRRSVQLAQHHNGHIQLSGESL